MDQRSIALLPSIPATFHHAPGGAFVVTPQTRWHRLFDQRCQHRKHARSRTGAAATAATAAEREQSPGNGVGSEHSEQKTGFQPPPPLDDDGWVVDMASLEDLVDSGALQVAKRPADYADRRSDGYTEPLELYVLGTSHVSEASAKHVRRVLEAVRPQSVVVELCKSRAGLMMPAATTADGEAAASNPLAMSGESFASSLARSIRIGGQSTALLRAALAWAARGSMADGNQGAATAAATVPATAAAMYGDFRAAKEGAEEAEAQIVLGDRPIEVTLKRAWEALSVGERLDLAGSLVQLAFQRSSLGGSGGYAHDGREGGIGAAEKVRARSRAGSANKNETVHPCRGSMCRSDAIDACWSSVMVAAASLRKSVSDGGVGEDALEDLIGMLAERFPSVVGPLIYERDLYLAWTLKRSRAVCGQRRVVGVMGRGHLSGVMRAIEADCGGDTLVFKKLTGKQGGEKGKGGGGGLEWPYSSKPSNLEKGARFAARLGVETAAGFALWELYKAVTAGPV
ncbi:unnamed protein product [Scytosiphon promiscuus]